MWLSVDASRIIFVQLWRSVESVHPVENKEMESADRLECNGGKRRTEECGTKTVGFENAWLENAATECEIKIKRTLLKITRADAHSYKRESMQILTYTLQSQTPSQYTYLAHYVKTWRHPQYRKYTTSCIVVRGDRATAKGSMYRKFCEVWTCCFWDMLADRQTHIHIYRHADLIAIFDNNKTTL